MEEEVFYNLYESRLEQTLLQLCKEEGQSDGTLLASDDIDPKCKELAPEYMADAVGQVADYPDAAVSWACYIGMAVARWWHDDWKRHSADPYCKLLGPRGFDDMDDHIVQDILGHKAGSSKAATIDRITRRLATAAIAAIRHEGIEPQSQRAFYVFAHTVKTMYRIGASIQLHQMGYHWEKLQ